MKGKIDKVPPSVNAIRVWLIRLGTGLIQSTGNDRQQGDWALTTAEAAKTSVHLSNVLIATARYPFSTDI